jgi:putative pyruvate formate lyase activating enzyme
MVSWFYLVRPDSVSVWENEEVRRRLSHYYSVMRGQRPAKYRVVKRMEADFSIDDSTESLWRLHDSLSREFEEHYREVAEGGAKLEERRLPERTFLDLKVELLKRIVRSCHLCEWRCGVDRTSGRRGVCGLDSRVRVASAFLHMGEEAPLVPSGTIFFTGCSFKCVFCQNWDISTKPENGVEVSPQELADIAVELYLRGARNINYVGGNPDQQAHVIVESLRYMDVNVPLLWNTNMYMSLELLRVLLDLVDIWLPDFKYGNDECARRLSGVRNYFEVVSRNHRIACSKGDMIIRHLVLPNHLDCCTKPVLEWIAKNCPRALVNIMEQYRPEHLVARYPQRWPDIARRPTWEEMREAYEYADRLGLCWRPVS